MKTNYDKLAQEIKTELLTLYASGGSADDVRNYWEGRMGTCEELDSTFNEKKLKRLVFNDKSN